MFEKLKAMGAVAGLLKNKEGLKAAFDRVKEKSAAARLTGTSGGGAVRAVASGQMQLISIELTAPLAAGMAADERTRILAGDLITQAVNDALRQARDLLKQSIDAEAKGLGLPEIPGMDALM